MQEGPSHSHTHLAPATSVSRRTIMALAAKLAGSVALSAIAVTRMAQVAAAEGEEIILTASASEVGARPGSSYARGNAALAAADQDAGAFTEVPSDGSTTPPGFDGTAEEPPNDEIEVAAKKCGGGCE